MSIISYAQNFEDVMLWRALGHIERGLYIDIGAQDPIIDSVSLAFHEHGWHGIHVEPIPHYAELLRQQRLGDTIIQAAVGNGPAVLRFFEIADTGISTANPGIAAEHRERGFNVHEITVPCVTLSAIFEASAGTEIHWLKIDVEGFEREVLSSWGSSAARPWIVVVESTLPLTQIETHQSWESILIAYGYVPVYFDGLNRYYVSEAHPEIKNAFLAPPNVFDGFTLNGTASAPFHKLIEARYQEKNSEALAQVELQRQSANDEVERLTLSLASLDQTHAEHEQNRAQREQTLSEQTGQAKQELESLLRNQVQREQEVAAQLLAIQQQAAEEKAEQVRSHKEQERVLHREYAEREQALNQQLQAGQEELQRLQQARLVREQALSEQTSQARQEQENLLRNQVKREQEVAAQLLAIQQLAAEEKAEQVRSHKEQERVLHREYAEREQALNQQLQAGQEELQHLQQTRVMREQALSQQTSQARQELEDILRNQVHREQEAAAQLLAIQDKAAEEKAEQVRSHRELERALHRKHAEHEKTLTQQLQAGQDELYRLQQDRMKREQALSEKASQARQQLEGILFTLARREQEVAAQLLAVQQQAAQEKTELVCSYSEQERALHRQHAEREQLLTQQLQARQEELRCLERDWAKSEKILGKEIAALQSEAQALHHAKQSQAQQYAVELSSKLDEHKRLIDACAALEAQIKAEIQSEQKTSLQLRQTLADVRQNLEMTHASLTWRMTAPLRMLTSFITSKKPSGSTVLSEGKAIDALMTATAEPQSINVYNAPIEPIMLSSTSATHPNTLALVQASTLDELLAYQDQQFVRCAFQTLLGRAPDAEGLSYYLGRLRTGYPKIQLLKQLRLSLEGNEYAAELPGLDKAIQRYQKGQLFLIGGLFRLIDGTESNNPTERKLRGIENQFFLLNDQSNRRFNQLEAALAGLHQLVVQQTQSVVAALDSKSLAILDAANIKSTQLATQEEIKQLSPRAREVYFKLKTAASNHAGRAA